MDKHIPRFHKVIENLNKKLHENPDELSDIEFAIIIIAHLQKTTFKNELKNLEEIKEQNLEIIKLLKENNNE